MPSHIVMWYVAGRRFWFALLTKVVLRKWLHVSGFAYRVIYLMLILCYFLVSRGQVNDQVPSSECTCEKKLIKWVWLAVTPPLKSNSRSSIYVLWISLSSDFVFVLVTLGGVAPRAKPMGCCLFILSFSFLRRGGRTLGEEMAISLVAFVLHLIVFLLWQLVVLLS